MNIVDTDINAIKPYENNPRLNDAAVSAVAKSIAEFGFQQPIVVDKDGVIIVGHTRYKAALLLGMTTVPVHTAANLSEAKVRAYRVIDNSTNQIAGWDLELLEIEVEAIKLDLPDLNLIDLGLNMPSKLSEEQIDDFFEKDTGGKPKEPTTLTCPHCGKTFEQ